MAGVKISGAEHPGKDILSDQFLFEISSYQRADARGVDEASAVEALECLNGLIGEAVLLARQLLVSPTTREGAQESLAGGAAVFAARLARAASVDT
jgi:hypothetical protein